MHRALLSHFLLVFALGSVECHAIVPKRLRDLCASLLGAKQVHAAREFEALALGFLDDVPGEPEAEFIGSRILDFPEIYLNARRRDEPSPLGRLMARPDLARAFFSAHPFNGLVAGDVLAIASRSRPEIYREALAEPMRRVVTTPASDLEALHPRFDVAREQAHALDLCRWLGTSDDAVVAAAFSFLDPALTRFKRASRLGGLNRRAYTAADFIHRLTRSGEIPPERIEWLVDRATNLGHPFRSHYWTALVSPTLNDAQIERLAYAWASPVLLPRERDAIRRQSHGVIETVEARIRRSPRQYKIPRPK